MKHLTRTTLLSALMTAATLSASAYDVCSDGVYYDINEQGAQVTYGGASARTASYAGRVSLPDSVEWQGSFYPVTTIGDSAFYGCHQLTSIALPATLARIGDCAFEGCKGLKKVIIKDIASWCEVITYGPSSNPLTVAGHLYADDDTEVLDLVIPAGVTELSDNAFEGCRNLRSVTLSDGIERLGMSTFKDCTALATVTVEGFVRESGEETFSGCRHLTKVVVRDLGAWCGTEFNNYPEGNPLFLAGHLYSDERTEVQDLVIPDTIKVVSDMAFAGCRGLRSVTLPKHLTQICEGAFMDCTGLTTVVVPDRVKTVGSDAFAGCERLASAVMGAGVQYVGAGVFYRCKSLKQVTMRATVPPMLEILDAQEFPHNFDVRGCTLVVPAGCAKAYRAAEGWKEFGVIKEAAK